MKEQWEKPLRNEERERGETVRWGNVRGEMQWGETFDVLVWNMSRKKTKKKQGGNNYKHLRKPAAFTLIQTIHMHPHVTRKTSKLNTLKPTVPVAHTRTVCPLSSSADYISDIITLMKRRVPPIPILILLLIVTGQKQTYKSSYASQLMSSRYDFITLTMPLQNIQ